MPRGLRVLVFGAWMGALAVSSASQEPAAPSDAVARAAAYLAGEVPRWRREHPCYSCHNNGDGARALIEASGAGLVDLLVIEDASGWLRTPERWALNSEDGGVKDLPLSRIQFAAALERLWRAGAADLTALERAAALVVADQQPDGSWPISATSNVGTPTGYGTPLATAMALGVLRAVETPGARQAVERTEGWFRTFEPAAVLEASAVLLGLDNLLDESAVRARDRALDIIERGQAPDGGWGPYVTAASEPFDTAVALLALSGLSGLPAQAGDGRVPDWSRRIERARTYLLREQNADGSWPETTRPALQDSYSQRVSTSAWALLALLGS